MKKLRYRKVKIVRTTDRVEYMENLCSGWTKYRDANNLWCYEKKGVDWNKCDRGKYYKKYTKCAEKYRRMLKKNGKKMSMENVKWYVVDVESGERMKSFDDINQAKKWCIENDFDFGMFK